MLAQRFLLHSRYLGCLAGIWGLRAIWGGVEDTFYFSHGKLKVTTTGKKFRKQFRRHAKIKRIGEKNLKMILKPS